MAMRPTTWTMNALAVELGMDRRTVAAILRDVPPDGKGPRGDEWRLQTFLRARGSEPGSAPDLDEAKARKMAAEAELAEMQRDERRGQLVRIEAVAKVVAEEYAAVRARLLSIPSATAQLLSSTDDHIECREILERAITDALDELARDGQLDLAAEDAAPGEGADAEAAAETDHQRVG